MIFSGIALYYGDTYIVVPNSSHQGVTGDEGGRESLQMNQLRHKSAYKTLHQKLSLLYTKPTYSCVATTSIIKN